MTGVNSDMKNNHDKKSWARPEVQKLGKLGQVSATGNGTGETNPGGNIKFLGSS